MVSWGFSTEGHPEVVETTNKNLNQEIQSDVQSAYTQSTTPMGIDDVIPRDDGNNMTLNVTVNDNTSKINNIQIKPNNLHKNLDLHDNNGLINKSQSGPPSLSSTSIDNQPISTTIVTPNSSNSEENYEGFGFVDSDLSQNSANCSSAPSPTNIQSPNSLKILNSPTISGTTLGRHTWLRTSLRRTPTNNNNNNNNNNNSKARQLGSNALASQLYRSGSFNSSGRGSTCDATDDMYSDISLEDDVIDLNNRVRMIQEQMDALVDNQSSLSISGERYARVKEENATLQARILMLEETTKDNEIRADEKFQSEQRRHRDIISRLEREKQLELENYSIKMKTIEIENNGLKDQITRLRQQLNLSKEEKERLEFCLEETNTALNNSRQSERNAVIRENEMRLLLENAKEELSMRLRDRQRIEELLLEVAKLTAKNKNLEELRDELQAATALHVGRELLLLNPATLEKNSKSLAAELSENSRDRVDSPNNNDKPRTMSEVLQSLKEQQEVNTQLRTYIDNILLNIVENYPQLLEVKQPH